MEKPTYADEHRFWIMPTTIANAENEFLVRGNGSRVWSNLGKEYIDACAQVSCANIGHNHPVFTALMEQFWERAKAAQVITAMMGTDFFYENRIGAPYHPDEVFELSPVALAKRLAPYCFGINNTAFGFHVTGAQAVNLAIRFFRTVTGKPYVISLEKAFHGRDGESRDVSDSNPIHWNEMPRSDHVFFLPYPEIMEDFQRAQEKLNALPLKQCAAFIYEPIQGEGGGMRVGRFLPELESILRGEGVHSVSDEIQAGLGRCGAWWGYQKIGCHPDAIVMGKSLGSGHPISAVAFRRDRCDIGALPQGKISGTFSMSPVSIAAANFTMHIYEQERIVEQAAKTGRIFDSLFVKTVMKANVMRRDRPALWLGDGTGLYRSIKAYADNAPSREKRDRLIAALRARGVWTLGASLAFPAVRITPPLNISREELALLAERIGNAIASVET